MVNCLRGKISRVALAVILTTAFCLLCLSGCYPFLEGNNGGLQAPPPSNSTNGSSNQTVQMGPFEQAAAAWDSGDYRASESLYQKLLTGKNLNAQQRSLAWQRLAQSYLYNKRYKESLQACNRWLLEQPSAQSLGVWQDCWITALTNIGPSTSNEELLESACDNTSKPLRLRAQAALLLASWQPGDMNKMATALQLFEQLHQSSAQNKAETEALLLAALQPLSDQSLEQSAALAQAERQGSLAYAAIKFEQARRALSSPENREYAIQTLNSLRQSSALSDKSAIDKLLYPDSANADMPAFSPGAPIEIGLLLPTSGPYGTLGWKVMRGAEIAQAEFEKYGQKLSLRLINTDDPNWLQTFRDLPASVQVIGGPIRPSSIKALQTSGLLRNKVVLAFMGDLGEVGEGREAWRFFFSQADQARALLHFAVIGCDLHNLGILTPDEAFGHKMAQVFREQAASYGLDIAPSAVATYPPHASQEWNNIVARMLGVSPTSKDGPPPDIAFQALFLPDGWSQAQMLIPQFYYYQEERLLFMGSALWTQSFMEGNAIVGQRPAFIISPGMWWPDNYAPSAAALKNALAASGNEKPDMWLALGYDFARFAVLLGRQPLANPEAINRALMLAGENMSWSIAPISWDPLGKASQRLYVFTPIANGVQLADINLVRNALAAAREAQENRKKLFYGEVKPDRQEWIDDQSYE